MKKKWTLFTWEPRTDGGGQALRARRTFWTERGARRAAATAKALYPESKPRVRRSA